METSGKWKVWRGKTAVGDFMEGVFVYPRDVEWIFGGYPAISEWDRAYKNLWWPPLLPGDLPSINFTHLTHDTPRRNVKGIDSVGFDGRYSKQYTVGKGQAAFSWWRFKVSPEKKKQYTKEVKELFSLRGNLKIGSSPVFYNGPSDTFGDFRFAVPIPVLLDSYRASMNCTDVEYRILGTVYFQKEIMYVVVICPENQRQFQHLSSYKECGDGCYNLDLHQETDWIWRPFSTTNFDCLWDQICFAFYLPPEKSLQCSTSTWKTYGTAL